MEGLVVILDVLGPAALIVFLLYLIQVLFMDAIYGVEYTDAYMPRLEGMTNEKHSKEGE